MKLQLTLAARYLWGRKLRTMLTTLAIVFGAAVIFGMNIVMPTMLEAFQSNMLAASGQVDATITHETGEAFSRNVLTQIRALTGVRAVSGSLRRTLNVPDGFFGRGVKVTVVTLVGLEPRSAQTLRNYPVEAGRFLRSSDEEEAVITTSLAESLKLELGDRLPLPTSEGVVPFEIIGLLPARALPGNEEVLVTLPEVQTLLDLPKRINTVEVNLDTFDPAQRTAILDAIQAQLGAEYEIGAMSSGADLFASIQIAQQAFNLFGFLALCMGGFIIFNTFRTVVAERRHDIGMLRSLGASRPAIIGMILMEGIVQGGVGAAIGIGLGYMVGVGATALMGPLLAQFLHVQIGAPVVGPALVIATVVLSVGVTLVAGLLPALSASRVTPLEALRPSAAQVFQRAAAAGAIVGAACIVGAALALMSGDVGMTSLGGLLFLVGLVLVAPALVKPIASVFSALVMWAFAREGTGALAQGNLTRQPSRAAITASATMIGLAIIVAVGGLTTSISGSFLAILQKSLGSDYLLMPPSVGVWGSNVGARPELADKLRAAPGVGAVSTMRFAAATADGRDTSLLGIDPAAFQRVAALTFQTGDAQSAYAALAAERALIVNGAFSAQTGLKMGDTLQLSTPRGRKTYRIAAVAGDYLNAKLMTAYISQANLLADFGKSEDVFIQINLAPGADPAQVESRLKEIAADYPQFKFISGRAYFAENKQMFDAAFATFYVMIGVLAFPSLIALLNTLAIAVIERTREIGVLRAVGATRRQVRRMVVAEALLLAAIGTAFGLLGGLYLGYVMVLGLSAGAGFPVSYSFPLAGLLAATAVGLLFGVLAALFPARQAARLEIVRALRYE
ncbi:MAG: ABC transporter permease [Anaerolineae bacterium]|nr:ABC transporter permease [Anaerolineae bacterium]